MAEEFLASNEFPGDGVTTLFNVSFKGNRPDAGSGTVPYLNPADVKAQQVTPATATTAEVVVDLTCTYVGPNQFNVTPVVPVGKIVRIYRATQDEYALVDYQALQTVGEADLDLSNRQVIFVVQEAHDLAQRASDKADDANTAAFNAVDTAGDALTAANAATATANAASSAAGNAVTVANNASSKADTAISTANAASASAAAANATAASAVATANSVIGVANAAVATANTALTTATDANNTALGVDAKAQTALDNSATAITTANAASSTANAIDGKAQLAIDTANAASSAAANATSVANGASTTANAVDAKAQSALDNSNTAISTANSAAAAVAGKQDGNANLTALSGLTGAADRLAYFTGVGAMALTTLTPLARTIIGRTVNSDMRTDLGLGNAATHTVQTGSHDTTVGALLKLFAIGGSFGWGHIGASSLSSISNYNAILAPGVWYGPPSTANAPTTAEHFVLAMNINSAVLLQVAWHISSNRMFWRTFVTSAWTAWNEVWHNNNFNPATKQNVLGFTPMQTDNATIAGFASGALAVPYIANGPNQALLWSDLNAPARSSSVIVAGGIGAYCFIKNLTGVTVGLGVTVSGASLQFTDTTLNNFGNPTGTWRCMSACANNAAAVWQRVS